MQEAKFFALQGGLDLVTPSIMTPAGRAIAASNYEPHPKGYQRIDGIERFDGRPKPSLASYWVLRFENGSVAVAEDDVVEGSTSSATGRAVVDAVVESGTYGGGDAAGYVVLMSLSGTFQDGESLEVSASPVADADGEEQERGASTDTDDMTWLQAAIEKTRAAILAVPGSGPVRGVWVYKGDIYAFRDNAGGTAGVMHKATAAGWAAQTFGNEIYFDGTTSGEFQDGETITGGTSGATATIERVVLQNGDWTTNDATGKLMIGAVTGGPFQDNETLTGGTSAATATAKGTVAAVTLPAGGRYDFDNYNFFGASNLERMYAANGVGRGFEWDGTVLVPIDTGMPTDHPTRIAAHRNYLFFAFAGGSLQNSALGNPYDWEVILGAGEFGIGEEITDLLAAVSGTLTVFGRNKIDVLFGTSADDWELREIANDAGAVAWTAQLIGAPTYLDSRGIRSLDTTQAFGDFRLGTKTQLVEPLFRALRRSNVYAVASLRVRAKDQYRLFLSDGTGLTLYFGRKVPEAMSFDFGFAVTSACSGKDDDGEEIMFVGNADGMVYQVDAGTSLDGEAVPAFLRLPFNHVGNPSQDKRWHGATLEIDAGPGTQIGMVAEFGYADPDLVATQEETFDVSGGGGFWDEANWDEFYWSSPVQGTAKVDIDGLGTNISLAIVSEGTYESPHVLHGLTLRYSPRRLVR